MPFVAAGGQTEEGTSRYVDAAGMRVHYHELGSGEPVMFLHTYGPGSTAWITFYKVISEFARHYRCILMDLPNFSKTGPVVFNESVHSLQARVAVQLMDALGIARAAFVGNSQGGQSSMVVAMKNPERVKLVVMGGSHIGTGGDVYLMANRPSEGGRATRFVSQNPTKENFRTYLQVHIDDEALVTDELVDYVHHAHTWSPEFEAARAQSVSVAHDYTPEMTAIRAPLLLVHGRYDRMVPFEVSINILNHLRETELVLLNRCGHWVPFEKPEEYTRHVLPFLQAHLRSD